MWEFILLSFFGDLYSHFKNLYFCVFDLKLLKKLILIRLLISLYNNAKIYITQVQCLLFGSFWTKLVFLVIAQKHRLFPKLTPTVCPFQLKFFVEDSFDELYLSHPSKSFKTQKLHISQKYLIYVNYAY